MTPDHSLIPLNEIELVVAFVLTLLVIEFAKWIGSKVPRHPKRWKRK